MKRSVGRMPGVVWLSVVCLGLLLSPLSAQEPKLRDTLKGHTREVLSVAFSPDGKTLASGSGDQTIKLWNMATGKEQAAIKGHTGSVWSVAFSPDGKTLASGSDDRTLKLWNVATGKMENTLRGHMDLVYSVAFSPDGKTVASGSKDQTIKLWVVKTGKKAAKGASGSTEPPSHSAASAGGALDAEGPPSRPIQ